MADVKKENRRGKIEESVKKITDAFVAGKLTLKEGQKLTPYHTAVLIRDRENLDSLPSTGSVSECFKRWEEIGFASFTQEPFSFKGYTAKGKELGLQVMKERSTAKKRAATKAAKAAEAGESGTAAPAKKAAAKKAPAAKKAAAAKKAPAKAAAKKAPAKKAAAAAPATTN